ncbi:hypothetical protein [Oceanisphaera pacifica]|uniref:Uncharacterized protein n=1 Tax=Oceanisphaera pacifica TaxID=2818389 RepID=A0ABS3NK20_9GAMM|nr:hypothetical protein [Oceanisphaera pacifica]MBO1520576.1 hypothetical protein [Oceanisphaera pacifica]
MKSAKEFAIWLYDRFKDVPEGVYLSRDDITTLSHRQHFSLDFVSDIHYELTLKGMGFVTGTHRSKFYLFHLPTVYWQHQEVIYLENSQSNVHPITKQHKQHMT